MQFLSVAPGTNHSIYFYGPEDGVRIPPGVPIENRLVMKCSPFVRQCGIMKNIPILKLMKGDIFMPKGQPNKRLYS